MPWRSPSATPWPPRSARGPACAPGPRCWPASCWWTRTSSPPAWPTRCTPRRTARPPNSRSCGPSRGSFGSPRPPPSA
ncbi:hypothetical protein ACFFX0_09790 [Citricoccus parietis]|uniref:Uncharacterized protein n=1 Tax=Citricoccus parietis TaxID=592307 RepID=A0ABV5FXR6_9MICC